MTTATDDIVETGGMCLAAGCTRQARYEVQMLGGWWWPECANHTADMRADLPNYILAVRDATATTIGETQ